jgi:hypothetical protein
MGNTTERNSTTYNRTLKDINHSYNRLSPNLYKLNGYQFSIMAQILSNKDGWAIVKTEIQRRLKFPERKFLKAWNELEALGYIKIVGKWGGYHYIINEDPDFTTGTGAPCVDHTTGNSTGCTDATLININKNYYNNITECTDATSYEKQFNELRELYPSSVTGSDGTVYYLKGKIEECGRLYADYLRTGKTPHEEIIKCLKAELANKTQTGKMYLVALHRWIQDECWEAYKGQINKPVAERYGTKFE